MSEYQANQILWLKALHLSNGWEFKWHLNIGHLVVQFKAYLCNLGLNLEQCLENFITVDTKFKLSGIQLIPVFGFNLVES